MMRYLMTGLLLTLLTFGLMMNDVYAKRFGGGRSFGVQRSQSALFSSKPQSTAYAAKPSSTNKWGGVLGGLLVGGLLASLFMGHGFASGILSWLLVGIVILFVMNVWKRKMQPGLQSTQAGQFRQPFMNQASEMFSGNSFSQSSNGASAYPIGFSADDFLRDAKVKFIRLQTAFDEKNLQDLRDFTSPEVFAEIKMQLDERGDAPNKTDVLQLEATLLDVSKQVDSSIASVQFTGKMTEEDGQPSPFSEIWHFRQFHPMGEWVVGGIQQE